MTKSDKEKKYGKDGINELRIRDNKTDASLFYLINAIDKDVRAEACREILKRALTDIYFGLNETELVKQKDLVEYINKVDGVAPTKQWMFTTGASIEAPTTPQDIINNIVNETIAEEYDNGKQTERTNNGLEYNPNTNKVAENNKVDNTKNNIAVDIEEDNDEKYADEDEAVSTKENYDYSSNLGIESGTEVIEGNFDDDSSIFFQ